MPRAATVRPATPATPPVARVPIKKQTTFTETIDPSQVPSVAVAPEPPARPLTRREELREELRDFEFWEKLQATPPEDWEHITAYLNPYDDRYKDDNRPWNKPPKGASYLEIYTQPFTIQDVKERFGGGAYWVMVNYDNRNCYSGKFRIKGPPKLEGVAAPAQNPTDDRYKEFLIDLVQQQMADVKAGLTKPDAAVDRVMELMAKANDATVEMLKAQIPKQIDAMTQLSLILDMLNKLQPAKPESSGGSSDLLKTVATLKELGVIPKPNENPFGGVKDLLESFKGLGIMSIGGGGGGRDDWKVSVANVLPQILGHVEGIVSKIVTGIVQTRPASPVQAAQNAAAQVRPGTTLVGQRAPAPGAGTPAPAAPGMAPNPAPAPAGDEAAQIQQAQVTIETWMWVRLVQLFQAGTRGDDVASFLQMSSPEAATYFGSQDVPQLESMIAQHPILSQMASHPRLKKFLEEFHGFFTEEEAPEPPEPTT